MTRAFLGRLEDGPGGPIYCNSNVTFNATLLDPIMADLKVYWPDDSANNNNDDDKMSVYEKEWTKYGSCLVETAEIEDELDFFTLGKTKLVYKYGR